VARPLLWLRSIVSLDPSAPVRLAVPRISFAPSDADPGAPADTLRAFYRWGWLPLVGGCALLLALAAWGAEALLAWLGHSPPGPFLRAYLLGWMVLTTVLLALWVGGYVLLSRRRIERVRDALRAQQVALAERAWRAEQAVGLSALSRALAHEIRGPLHGIALHTVMLRRLSSALPPERRERLEGLADALAVETGRLEGLLSGYESYGQHQALHAEPLALEPLVHAVVANHRAALERSGVQVRLRFEPGLPPLSADVGRLEQALHGLVRHAKETVPPGGYLMLDAARSAADELQLSATYGGRVHEDPEELLRPFFQPRPGASGLGLAIARDVVRAHGGQISASNAPPDGACVTLRLPLAQPGRSAEEASAS
jgi:signal transduction histidine kinase